jgi:oligosaccharide repeat unit polymerase
VTWTLFRRLSPPQPEFVAWSYEPLRRKKMAGALRFTLLMGIIALSVGLYRVAVVAAHFQSNFFYLILHPGLLRLRLVIYLGTTFTRISYIPMIISLTSSFFAVGFVLLGVYLYLEERKRKYFYLAGFLTVSLAIGLTNLSRFEVTVNILYLIMAYSFMYSTDRRKSPRRAVFDIVVPFASIAALFVAIDLLLGKSALYGHTDRLRGALFSTYWYIASPLAAFNEFISTSDGHHHLGEYMFYPFYKWFYRFGLAPEPQMSYYGEKVYLPFMTNVYTYLRNIYEDFGIIGIAVVPYLLGWATCAVRLKAARSFAYLNLYLVLLAMIFFSFYNYYLVSNQIYLQILFAFVFFGFELQDSNGIRNRLSEG